MSYFYEDSIKDLDNCIRPTTSGWAVYWEGTKVKDGLTHEAAVTEFRELQAKAKK